MIFKIFLISLIWRSVHGVPLEGPTDNLKQFFSERLMGGYEAPQAYAPFMAALLAGEGFTLISCGGSIVQTNLILTGARCITTMEVQDEGRITLLDSFHGRVGATNRHTQGTRVEFINYHIHPQFNPRHIKNDIGFLVLDRHVRLSDRVQLISLNFDWIGADEPSYVTGWGMSRRGWYPFQMQALNVTTIGTQKCVDEVKEANIWWGGGPEVDPNVEICTYDGEGKGLCHGDAGNPLVSRKTRTQIGIASWAFTCALGVPDMYTRISAYKDYVQGLMAKYQ